MKIGIAQIKPVKGNIEKNIEIHIEIIGLASNASADAIFFSELSITSYEPVLANDLKIEQNDKRLKVFQQISDLKKIVIGIGAPLKVKNFIHIAMLIFQPSKPVLTYSKQILHNDEKTYFVEGDNHMVFEFGKHKIAPAICYESLQMEHLKNSIQQGADIYIASVAKSQKGIDKAQAYFPIAAKEYSIPILMSNCIGKCDNFESAGQSAVWDMDGNKIDQLSDSEEGILIFDTENKL